MIWIILNQQKNNFGDLIVTFLNIKTGQQRNSVFSEGEHGQLPYYLKSLNETQYVGD